MIELYKIFYYHHRAWGIDSHHLHRDYKLPSLYTTDKYYLCIMWYKNGTRTQEHIRYEDY